MEYKKFFEEVFKDTKIDKHLAKEIKRFRKEFENVEEHHNFLNEPYLGLHLLRFTSDDEVRFYNILNVDYRRFISEFKRVTCINHKFENESNPFYNILMALAAKVYNSKLSKHEAEDVVVDLYHIFIYKAVGSYLSIRFGKYLASKEAAVETYERLSNSYLVKIYGTWGKVFDYKAEIVTLKHNYGKRLKSFKCRDVVSVIIALKTMVNARLGDVYTVYKQVLEDDQVKKMKESMKADLEGNHKHVALDDNPRRYIDHVTHVIGKQDFIKREYLEIVESLFTNVSKSDIEFIISYFNDYYHKDHKLVSEIIESIVISSLDYLHRSDIKADLRQEIVKVVMLVKNYYSSGKVKDRLVLRAKHDIYIIVRAGLNIKTGWKITPLSIAIVVYIAMTAFLG